MEPSVHGAGAAAAETPATGHGKHSSSLLVQQMPLMQQQPVYNPVHNAFNQAATSAASASSESDRASSGPDRASFAPVDASGVPTSNPFNNK